MKIISTIVIILQLSIHLFAQTTINGHVKEKGGDAIIGANIFIQNTFDGTSSDLSGDFSFSTDQKGEIMLIVSYLGYRNFEQALHLTGDSIHINIQLKPDAATLQAVTISAGTFEAGDENKAVVLNSIDIATTAGALADIASAMNTLPGTQRNGETGQLFVRGGAASETRTFIDGMYVQNPYNSTTNNVPARGRFSPFLFKGTSFSTGGYSAEYGQALSSALILNTQDLAEETVTGLSIMTVGLGASHTQAWEKTSLSASLDYTNLAPYMELTPQNIAWETAPRSINGQVIFRQKTSETGLLKFYISNSRGDFTLQYPDFSDVNKTTPLSLSNNNLFSQITYQEMLGEKWSLSAGVGFTQNADEIDATFYLKEEEQAVQSRATLKYQLNDHILIKGGGIFVKSNFEEWYEASKHQTFKTNLEEEFAAGFLEADIYFSKKWVGRVGGRLEHSQLLNQYNVAPRLSLAYQVNDEEQFSLALGQFYQSSENELLRYHQNLAFEQANHYIAGYQVRKNDRILRVEGYYKDYQNLIKYDEAQPHISANTGSGYARGVDVFFRDQKSLKYGDYWISYSFLDTERDYLNFPTAVMPHFASRHNLSAVYKHWIADWNTSMGITYSYGSPRPFHDPNSEGFNTGRTKPFNDLSINFSHLTNLWGQMTILHISASNILNIKNTFGYQYSAQPNEEGLYDRKAVRPTADQFFFVGLFISIGEKYTITKDDL